MKKLYFLLFTLLITSLTFGQTSDLYFSMYAEGSSNNKFVEIYNGTGGSIDLSNYMIKGSNNGGGWIVARDVALSGTLLDGEVYVISTNQADASILAVADLALAYESPVHYNGDDAIGLFKDDGGGTFLPLDIIGVPDVDPGSAWDVAGVMGATGEHTLTRKTSVCGPNSDWASSAGTDAANSEWVVTAQDSGWGDLGTYTGCSSIPTITITSPGDFEVLPYGTTDVDIEFILENAPGGSTVSITVTANAGSPVIYPSQASPFNISPTSDGDTFEVTAELIDGGILDFETINFSIENAPPSLPLNDDFTYTDGNLVPNGGWASFSGSSGAKLLVSSGQAVIQHGSGSREDASIEFIPVSGNVYYALDFSVDNLGGPYSGTGNEYFAMFKDDAFNYAARLDIVPPTAGGDFSVGIASDESTADAIWATDLTFDTTYRAIVRFNQDTNQAELWIDASTSTDPSILGEDRGDPGDVISHFALRQSDTSEDETVRVDNVNIGTSFGAVLSTRDNQIEGFSFSPNPTDLGYVNIKSRNNAAMQVSVYDILGKQVLKETINNDRLNVSSLNTGIYIMKVSQDNATTTKKLVIK